MNSRASMSPAAETIKLEPIRSRGGSQARGRAIALAIDRAALRAAYEAGASTVDLALEHGISRTTIRELLIDMGCELRGIRSAARVREMPSWLRLEMPTPVDDKRFVDDVEGTCFRVTHVTPTRHGFDVLRGLTGKRGSGPPAIVLTREMTAHFEAHRLDPRNLDLPISQALSNRLRRRLGHDYKVENAAWWKDRLEDLDRLDIDTFSAKHGVVPGTVEVMRLRLCGKRPRRAGTRLDAQSQAIVFSDRPAREAAALLGKSVVSIYALRRNKRLADSE